MKVDIRTSSEYLSQKSDIVVEVLDGCASLIVKKNTITKEEMIEHYQKEMFSHRVSPACCKDIHKACLSIFSGLSKTEVFQCEKFREHMPKEYFIDIFLNATLTNAVEKASYLFYKWNVANSEEEMVGVLFLFNYFRGDNSFSVQELEEYYEKIVEYPFPSELAILAQNVLYAIGRDKKDSISLLFQFLNLVYSKECLEEDGYLDALNEYVEHITIARTNE